MTTSLTSDSLAPVLARLKTANTAFTSRYSGDSPSRQPVHTVYGGAHLFRRDSAPKLGELALRSLRTFAPNAATFAAALGLANDRPAGLAETVYARTIEKLEREPVEDFRIDFEDGYGLRPDAEEDATATQAAAETAGGLKDRTLPPFIGIRIKPLNDELHRRSIRTLDLFLSALTRETGGVLPGGFVVTLPKVVVPEHVSALADVLDAIEPRLGLAPGSVRLEVMIETTQSILDADGRCTVPALVRAARGRCVAAHFGVYDYTASTSITAEHQRMNHPACDFARDMMQVALGGTGVWISDGATNIMPSPPHRAEPGRSLSPAQEVENRAAVHHAWRLHFDDVRRSLVRGYYQGWDLNPAQLPTRYAALLSFFLEGLPAASERLKNFIDKAARATLVGGVFDDAATGQGLINFFLRGVDCGAITTTDVQAAGLSPDELRTRSFSRILAARAAP